MPSRALPSFRNSSSQYYSVRLEYTCPNNTCPNITCPKYRCPNNTSPNWLIYRWNIFDRCFGATVQGFELKIVSEYCGPSLMAFLSSHRNLQPDTIRVSRELHHDKLLLPPPPSLEESYSTTFFGSGGTTSTRYTSCIKNLVIHQVVLS